MKHVQKFATREALTREIRKVNSDYPNSWIYLSSRAVDQYEEGIISVKETECTEGPQWRKLLLLIENKESLKFDLTRDPAKVLFFDMAD